MVPIHKQSSCAKPSNYRPVSLLSIISKVMESIVNNQLVNYLEKHNCLPSSQFGFRRRRGAADLLTILQHEWTRTVAQGGHAQVVAVDIAGAFDRVSHVGVIAKDQEAGIGGKLLHWLLDYLTDRKANVVVGGYSSDPHTIGAGVPQGSILGPTLFLLYVRDIDQCLCPDLQLVTFADDTTLYSLAHNVTLCQSTASLQRSLNSLYEWGQRWRIPFEPSKTQRLIICRRRTTTPDPILTFGNVPIETTDKLKLLSITFDPTLSFRPHLHNLAVRANRRLTFLRKAGRVPDKAGRMAAYKGFIRPLLEYAPLAWLGAAQTHLVRLDRVQQKAMKLIGPGTLLQSLPLRRMVAATTYLYKLHYTTDPPQLTQLLPHAAAPHPNPYTRLQLKAHHQFQLLNPLPQNAPDYLQRSFPYSIIKSWNNLPPNLLVRYPHEKGIQLFKTLACQHHIQRDWLWATNFAH